MANRAEGEYKPNVLRLHGRRLAVALEQEEVQNGRFNFDCLDMSYTRSLNVAELRSFMEAILPKATSLQELDISRAGLDDETGQLLAELCAAEQFGSLLCLDLHENLVSQLAADALASKTFLRTSCLRKLDVSRCDMQEDAMLQLVPGLAKLAALEILNIGGNHVSTLVSQALATSGLSQMLLELLVSDAGVDQLSLQSLCPLLTKLISLYKLDISRNDIGTAGCEALAAIMPDMPSFCTVDVRGCNLTRLAAEAFASTAALSPKLEEIIFGEAKLMSQFVATLPVEPSAMLDSRNPLLRMERLNLSKARVEFGGVRGMEKGLGTLTCLDSLLLHGNEIGDASSASALASHALARLEKLRDLDLGNCSISQFSMQQLSAGVAQLVKLERLILRDNMLGETGVAALADKVMPNLPGLRELGLANCDITPEAMSLLSPAFSHCPLLETLSLAGNEIEAEGLEYLVKAATSSLLPCVVDLDLSNCGLEESACGALAILAATLKHLKRLLLRHNELGGEDFYDFGVGLAACAAQLRTLDLDHCGLNAETLIPLTSSMASCVCLERLGLAGNSIAASGADVLRAALKATARNLKQLDVSYCDLDEQGLVFIGELLADATQLEVLNLRNNPFGAAGIRAMAEHGLPSVQALKQLDMRGCLINEDSARALAAVLARLRRLEHLEFGDQTLLRHWVAALAEQECVSLESWKALRLDGAGITEANVEQVFAGIQRLSSLELLSLSGNRFGGQEGVAFESTLRALPRLGELQLSNCQLAAADMQLLSRAFRQHADRTEKLLLHGNRAITDDGAKELATVALPNLMWLKEVNFIDTAVTQAGLDIVRAALGPRGVVLG